MRSRGPHHVTPSGQRAAVETEVEKLRRLTEIGRALTYATTLEQVALIAVERGAALLGAVAAVLMLPDADGLLHVRGAHGVDDARLARFRAPLDDETVARLQGLLGVPDDCFLAVPLVAGGAVTGLLAVALTRPSATADEWMLSALADQVAVALENARLSGEVRLEMEDRLRASEGAGSSKDRALATLAHDVRNPLGAIDGYCQNMEEGIYGPISDQQRKVLHRVRMSGRHLLSLLDNVLEMARLSAGVVAVNMKPVRLAEVAREAVEMLGPASAAKLQVLELRVDGVAADAAADAGAVGEIIVASDQARLRQVLVNLLGNAVKFTPNGGTITVATLRCDVDGTPCGIAQVSDTGPGIAAEEQRAIFEPYYRSEGTAVAPGVGLGLAISHLLVRQMGGELTVESTMGAGATFAVRFPLYTDELPTSATAR